MKTNCLNCNKENPKHGMKTCCRKCADEFKTKTNSSTRECLYCKTPFTVRNSNKKVLCSEKCRIEWSLLPENKEIRIKNSKESIKVKYGVDNVFQLDEIKDKYKKTKLEKYGDENYNNGTKSVNTKREKYGEDYYKNMLEKQKVNTYIRKYGVNHPLKLDKFKQKQKETIQKKYGVDNVSKNEKVKSKRTETIIEKYGVENASQSEEIKQKKKETSIKNYGVSHHLKDYKMLQKHLKSQYKVKKYKDTNIFYQGSYELYFLELIEQKGFIGEIKNGKSFTYKFDNLEHTYHTDFELRGKQIEIKSGWTYNGNGTNQQLQLLNECKWKSVKEQDFDIIILIDKLNILAFVNSL